MSKLIESITIKNLRGIKQCTVNNLTDINIFIGKNGAGKSTILEAIYLASSWAEPEDQIRDMPKHEYVISRRGGRGKWTTYKHTLWFNKKTDEEIEINFNFKSQNKPNELIFKLPYMYNPSKVDSPVLIEVSRQRIPEIAEYHHARKLYLSSTGDAWNPKTKTSYKTSLKEKVLSFAAEEITYLENAVLLDNRFTVSQLEQKVWGKIFDKRLDKEILEFIREEYEPTAENILYKPSGEGFVLAFALPQTTVEIDSLGDGARMAILYASPLLLASDTAVLIEDPEAHQHPGGLATFTRFAFKTAKKQRLQLFITTHSIELLNIAKEISKELGLGLRIYYMERGKDGYVDVRAIEEPDLETLQKIGLDPRMLHIL
uniref:ATP-binding cassette domain-containing protein n=1 Tax=Thermofilum adornatum TaxID=1365176 RepID=A0A7C1GA90_9CREN